MMMRSFLLPRLLLAVSLTLCPAASLADNTPTSPPPPAGQQQAPAPGAGQRLFDTAAGALDKVIDAVFGGVSDAAANALLEVPEGPTYRPKNPIQDPTLDAVRTLIDELIARDYKKDAFLEQAWRRYQSQVERATEYIRVCDRTHLELSIASLMNLQREVRERKAGLETLKATLEETLRVMKARYDQAKGTETPGEHLLKNLGVEALFSVGAEGADYLADWTEGRTGKNPAYRPLRQQSPGMERFVRDQGGLTRRGECLRWGGRTIAVLNTVQNLKDLAEQSFQANQMMTMIPHLLEINAMLAYLDGLIVLYDRMLDSQRELLEQLSNAFDEHKCRRCDAPSGTTGVVPGGGTQPATGGSQRPPETKKPAGSGSVRRSDGTQPPPRRSGVSQAGGQKSAVDCGKTKITTLDHKTDHKTDPSATPKTSLTLPVTIDTAPPADAQTANACPDPAHQAMSAAEHQKHHQAAPQNKTKSKPATAADSEKSQTAATGDGNTQTDDSKTSPESPAVAGAPPAEPVAVLSPMQQMIKNMCDMTLSMYRDNMHMMVDEGWQAPKPPRKGTWTALLQYDLQRDGKVTNVKVVQSSGYAPIDQSAVSRVMQLQHQFRPIPDCYDKPSMTIDHTFKVIYR